MSRREEEGLDGFMDCLPRRLRRGTAAYHVERHGMSYVMPPLPRQIDRQVEIHVPILAGVPAGDASPLLVLTSGIVPLYNLIPKARKGNAMSDLSQPVPPPPGAPQQPVKKGLGPLGWVLIGCGGLIVVGAIAIAGMMYAGGRFLKNKAEEFEKNPTYAAAKLAVQVNPDLEIVSSDEKNGTLTIKNKKTGEVITMSAEDAKEGRWTFKSDQGTATFDTSGKEGVVKVTTDRGTAVFGAGLQKDLPSWLPVYPGGTVQGSYDTSSAEGRTAAFTVNTKDSVTKVLDYYEAQLKAAGLKTDKSTFSANDQVSGGSVSATSGDQKRTANVMVAPSAEGTSAVVTFQEKN